jgi:uncharacterized membrane protein YbaN (DUF454 family)
VAGLGRVVLMIAGSVFVLLGIVGVVVPVLPTTPFVLLAIACYSRSSPRLAARLEAHPWLGPTLRAWRNEGAIASRAKVAAVFAMALGYGAALVATPMPLAGSAAIAVALVACAVFIVTRPRPTADDLWLEQAAQCESSIGSLGAASTDLVAPPRTNSLSRL